MDSYNLTHCRNCKNTERKQITLRMPDRVYGALREEAEEKGITVNELILLKINPLKVDFLGILVSSGTVSK